MRFKTNFESTVDHNLEEMLLLLLQRQALEVTSISRIVSPVHTDGDSTGLAGGEEVRGCGGLLPSRQGR